MSSNRIFSALVIVAVVFLIAYGVYDRLNEKELIVTYDDRLVELYEVDSYEAFGEAFSQAKTIPLVELNTEFKINMNDLQSDEFEIHDYILDDQGRIRFTDFSQDGFVLEVRNTDYYFTIHEHPAIMLSSKLETEIYRGIEIIIKKDESVKSYLFVIRTPVKD